MFCLHDSNIDIILLVWKWTAPSQCFQQMHPPHHCHTQNHPDHCLATMSPQEGGPYHGGHGRNTALWVWHEILCFFPYMMLMLYMIQYESRQHHIFISYFPWKYMYNQPAVDNYNWNGSELPAFSGSRLPAFSMLSGYWAALVCAVAYWDLRRLTVSELAIGEAGLLRQEIGSLRQLIEQLEQSISGCSWETWVLWWIIRILVVLLVAVLIGFFRQRPNIGRAPLLAIEGPVSSSVELSDTDPSPTTRPSTVVSSSSRGSGPLRPSDLRRLRDGTDAWCFRDSGVGALSTGWELAYVTGCCYIGWRVVIGSPLHRIMSSNVTTWRPWGIGCWNATLFFRQTLPTRSMPMIPWARRSCKVSNDSRKSWPPFLEKVQLMSWKAWHGW